MHLHRHPERARRTRTAARPAPTREADALAEDVHRIDQALARAAPAATRCAMVSMYSIGAPAILRRQRVRGEQRGAHRHREGAPERARDAQHLRLILEREPVAGLDLERRHALAGERRQARRALARTAAPRSRRAPRARSRGCRRRRARSPRRSARAAARRTRRRACRRTPGACGSRSVRASPRRRRGRAPRPARCRRAARASSPTHSMRAAAAEQRAALDVAVVGIAGRQPRVAPQLERVAHLRASRA